jgi:hypothetical protein
MVLRQLQIEFFRNLLERYMRLKDFARHSQLPTYFNLVFPYRLTLTIVRRYRSSHAVKSVCASGRTLPIVAPANEVFRSVLHSSGIDHDDGEDCCDIGLIYGSG